MISIILLKKDHQTLGNCTKFDEQNSVFKADSKRINIFGCLRSIFEVNERHIEVFCKKADITLFIILLQIGYKQKFMASGITT